MKSLFLMTLYLIANQANAVPFAQGNAERGAQLFAQFDCNSCHRAKVGGDGNAIFTRADRRVTQPALLVGQIKQCSGAVGANYPASKSKIWAAT
jgi:hypothetical protein